MSEWFVYIARCSDNSLYTGVTTDLARRIEQHNTCNKTGAKYTRMRRPIELVYSEHSANRSTACQREYQIKQLNKVKKEALVLEQINKKNVTGVR